jgi:Flp pilus assembly protein TadG
VAEAAHRDIPVTTPASPERPRPRGRFRALCRDQRGTAVVEFALVAPVLFLLIFGIVDFGRALNYYNQETQLAGLGARAAAVNRDPKDTGAVASGSRIIQTELDGTYAKGELQNNTTFCINPDSGGAPSAVGQPVTVTASYQFHFLPLVGAALGILGPNPSITVQASQTERQEVTGTYDGTCQK